MNQSQHLQEIVSNLLKDLHLVTKQQPNKSKKPTVDTSAIGELASWLQISMKG